METHKVWNIVKKVIVWGILIFIFAMLLRLPFYLQNKKTAEQVVKIHATKLTLDDVMGKNLPPDPGAEADKTVVGVDANRNGIRDDVELAIFKEYPKSAKTRAVLLQYALALQMEMTLPILNRETATAVVEDTESRADICIWSLSSRNDMDKFTADIEKYRDFVKKQQVNTEKRKKYTQNFYKYVGSYTSSNDSCDIDSKLFSN